MIVGIGVDLVDVRRIGRLIEIFGDRFLCRYFSDKEVNFCFSRLKSTESFSKIFAIKEAVFKAISLKNQGILLKNIEVTHAENGKPCVILSESIINKISGLFAQKSFNVEVSVSDEIPYACAFVVIQTI